MYEDGLQQSEIEEIRNRLKSMPRTNKNRFLEFTDVLIEYIGSGEWRNQSEMFLAMCAKGAFFRGKYGFNLVIAKSCSALLCKGYAAAAYCRQSLDPRWINNLRNYLNQAWQAKDYVAVAELSTQLASVLVDLGYTDHANEVASDSIDRVTKETAHDESIRNKVQAALLSTRITLAHIISHSGNRDEAILRLDSAEDTAKLLDMQLCLTDIEYYRAIILEESVEYERALALLDSALYNYEQMGYLNGVGDARNLKGIILTNQKHLQEARDQFEELLVIQQQLNNQIGLARSLINVGEIDRNLGQLDQMETYNQRALEISHEAEYMKGIAVSSINLGDVSLRRGDLDEAISYYTEAKDVAEGSGMKDVSKVFPFLIGDAFFLKEDYEKAIESYNEVEASTQDSSTLLRSFIARVSKFITYQAMNKPFDKDRSEYIKSIIGSLKQWTDNDQCTMQGVRSKLLADPTVQSNICIFYDAELNFECRVERTTLPKECTGNLFWKSSLCPHFVSFLKDLQ